MMKYYVTWAPESAEAGISLLTWIDGVIALTPDQIMEIVFAVEDMQHEDYVIYSIIRAADAEVIM